MENENILRQAPADADALAGRQDEVITPPGQARDEAITPEDTPMAQTPITPTPITPTPITPEPAEAIPNVPAQQETPTEPDTTPAESQPSAPPPAPPSVQPLEQQPAPAAATGLAGLLSRAKEKIQFRKRAKLEKIVQLVREKGKITNNDVQKLLRCSDATATRYLAELVKQGRLRRVGPAKQPFYEFLDPGSSPG